MVCWFFPTIVGLFFAVQWNGFVFAVSLYGLQFLRRDFRCEMLGDVILQNRQQLQRVESLRTQLPIPMEPQQDLLPSLNAKITALLSSLVTSTFIVERQPPQVMKVSNKARRPALLFKETTNADKFFQNFSFEKLFQTFLLQSIFHSLNAPNHFEVPPAQFFSLSIAISFFCFVFNLTVQLLGPVAGGKQVERPLDPSESGRDHHQVSADEDFSGIEECPVIVVQFDSNF